MAPHSGDMRTKTTVPEGLQELARVQAGVVSCEQASYWLSRHVIQRLLTTGEWSSLAQGLYLTHTGQATRSARQWAALLAGGQGASFALHTAAQLWRLEEARDPLTVQVPHARRTPSMPGVEFHRTRRPIRSCGT